MWTKFFQQIFLFIKTIFYLHNNAAQEKANQLLEALKGDNEMVQQEAASELCNYFSVGTEASVASIKAERFIPEFIKLLHKEHNDYLMSMFYFFFYFLF